LNEEQLDYVKSFASEANISVEEAAQQIALEAEE